MRAGLQLLRYIFSEDLGQRLPEVFRHLRQLPRADALEYARTLLAYLSSAGRKVKKEEIRQAMQEVFPLPELQFDKSALFIQEWMEEGREEGREEGLAIGKHDALSSLTLRLLRRQIGELDEATQARIRALPDQRLEELGEALLDFTAPDELHNWLRVNDAGPQTPDN